MNNQTHISKLILFPLMTILLFSCKTTSVLPTIKYNQYEYGKSYSYQQDTLTIKVDNPLHSPLRVWIFSTDEELQTELNEIIPITLDSLSDAVLTFSNIQKSDRQIRFSSRLGDTSKKIEHIEFDLPFPKGKSYTIIQENNTNFTHNSDVSRFALDFDLKTNDFITSATDGFVVGVVDKYKHSGVTPEWEPFGNFLTIYDPISGIFTQYVHLVENGSLVKIGDKVVRGQKIALSGNTGQSTTEHLHFSALIPVNSEAGLESIPITFVGGIHAINLKKGDILKN